MPDIFDNSESRITNPLLVERQQPATQLPAPALTTPAPFSPPAPNLTGEGAITEPVSPLDSNLPGGKSRTLPETPKPAIVEHEHPINTTPDMPPPIESDTDAWEAATALSVLPPTSSFHASISDMLADYQTRSIMEDYRNPVEQQYQKKLMEAFDNVDALARDWTQEPQARDRALKAFGQDFVTRYEQSTEDGRAFLCGMKLLEELYTRPGDNEFAPLMRFMNATGTRGLKGAADAWRHFQTMQAPLHAEEARQQTIAEGLTEKASPIIERMLAGDTLFTAIQSVPGLSPDERGFLLENCHAKTDFGRSLHRLREWMTEQKMPLAPTEEAIAARMEALDKQLNYTRQTAGMRGGFLTGELVSETVRTERYTEDELRTLAIEELAEESVISDDAIVPFARAILKLKQEDYTAYRLLGGLYQLHARRERNEGSAFISPFARTMRNMSESALDAIIPEWDASLGDSLRQGISTTPGAPTPYAVDSSGTPIHRRRRPELAAEVQALRSIQQEIAESPDGAGWWREQFDGLGKLSAQTTFYLATRGLGTFTATSGDRYNELIAAGHSPLEAVLRGGAAGLPEVLVERLGGEFFGRNLRMLAVKFPFMQNVTGLFGGAVDQFKRGFYGNAALRFTGYTLAAGATEWSEELITPTLQMPLDAGIAWLFDSKDGMSWADWRQQINAACDPNLIFQMTIMGGIFGATQLPTMAREAQIARIGAPAVQAITRTTTERAQQIANIPNPADKLNAIMEEAATNGASPQEQVKRFNDAVNAWARDLSGIKAMEAYQAQVELGALPRLEEQPDGTVLLYDKVANDEGRMVELPPRKATRKEAAQELMAKMESEIADQMEVIQGNLITRATIESMKSSGKFIFEKMTKTETMETIRQRATAARLRISEGANPSDTIVGDPKLSPHMTLQQQIDLESAAETRMGVAKAQGMKASGFRSNAYRMSLDRSRHLIRYVEGKITFDNFMEEMLESYIMEHLFDSGHTLDWYAGHLREAQKLLTERGILKNGQKLIREEGDVAVMDVVEAMGFLARADVYARIDSLNIPQFIKDFLKWCRTLISYVGHMAELGHAVRELADSGKLDKDIYQLVYDAAGITQEYWADAAMDSTHQTLADIAMAAVQGKQLQGNIAEAVAAAWSAAEQPGEPTAPDAPEEHPEGSTTTATISAGKPAGSSGASFSISPTLREDISNAWHHKTKSKTRIPLCSCPDVFRVLGLLKADIVTQASTISKLRNNHGLSIDEIEQAIGGFNDPVLVFRDSTAGDIILFPGMSALNKKGMQGDIMAAIKLERTPDKKHYMASLYPLDGLQKIEAMFNVGSLLYSRYTEQALGSGSNAPGLSSELLRLLVAKGFSTNTITEEAVVKWKNTQNALPENAVKFAEAMQQKLTERITATREAAHHDPDADPAVTGQQIADLSAQLATWQEFYRYPELMAQASAWDGNESTLYAAEPAVAVDLSGGKADATRALVSAGIKGIEYRDDTASFSLVGEHAENWEEIKHNAFTVRDDGKLRVELDASQARIKPSVEERILRRMAGDRSERKVRFTLADVLDYPELYRAYPKLAKMAVVLSDLGARGTRAWYNPKNNNIRINTLNFTLENWDAEALRSTLLHEVQHAIQHIEGFANGNGGSNWDEYQRSAGEIEARAVQKRRNMTAEERAANPVNDMLEYPGRALVNIDPPPIEVPFNLVSGAFEEEWGALRRSGNKAHIAFVQNLVNALNKDAERLARYQDLAEDERGDMAVTLLRATNLAKTAVMYLPKGWRIGLKPYLDWMEVFAEVAHHGKLDWSASAIAPFWEERMQEHLKNMMMGFGIATGDAAQAMALLKDYGETRLYMLVNKLLKRVSNNLEEYGRKKMEDKIEELFQSINAKTSKTRRTLRGVVSKEAYEEIKHLEKLAHYDEKEYQEAHEKLVGKLTEKAANEAPQEEREALDNKLLELEVYGCMGMKSLDELDRLYTCLVRHIRGEKEAWKALHEARQQRRRELAEGIIAGVKGRKGDYDASEEEAKLNSSLFRQGLAALETIESFPQLLYVLEKYPDTAALANNIRNRLALADGSYSENRVVYNDKFRNWVATAFGIDTKKMLANRAIDKVLNEFNKRKDTEIRLKEYEKKNLRLPLELALMRISGEDTAELRAELEAKLADLQARLAAEDMGNRPLTEQEQAAVARKEELTLTTEPMNDKEVDSYLREHASGDITNIATGIVGTIASNQRDKLVSRKAKDASVEGGFTYTQHNYAASRIAALFKHAIPMGVYEDKNGRIPAIHRFACPLILDGRVSLAFMTVKETEGKKPKGVRRQPGQPTPARTREHKIYSIQLDKIEELGSQLGRVEHLKHFHSPSSEEMIAQFNAAVNDYFLNVPESKVSLPPTLETDKAIKEVEKRLAALDMKLDAQDIDALRAWFELTPTARRAAEILRKPETERTPDELSVINKTFKKRHVDLTYNRLLRERSKSEHMSQNAALYLILSYEQEDNRARMEAQGWTADVIDRLRTFVGESGLKLGYLMRDQLNNEQRKRISRIFERENGVPFANIENYFPLRFMRTDKDMQNFDMAAMLGGMSGGMGGSMTGFLAQRTDNHNLKIARGLGATAVWRDAVNTSEWWMQYQDILADLKAVLGHEGVHEALTVQFGKNTAVMLNQWVKDIEQMGHKENNARCGIQLFIDRMYEAGAISILSYRLETVIKQFTGLLNIFVGDNTLTFGDWVRGMCVTAAGKGRVSFLQMLKSPYIRSRINTGNDIAGERLARMGEDRAFSAGERMANFGMLPMGVVDAGVNAAPATALYNAHFMRAKAELKADGSKRTDKEADAIARMHMLSAFDFATQPLNFMQKSRLGVLLNSNIAGRAVAFMMSENYNKLGIWHALLRRRQGKKLIGFWLLYGAFNSAIGMLLDAMRDDPEEWEERDMMGYIWSALFGGLTGIPLFSESLEALLKLCGVDIYLGSSARGLIDGRSFVRRTARLYDMLMEGETDLEEWAKEFPRLMRTFGIVGGAFGGAFGGFLLFAAGMANPAKTANQALDSALLYALNPWDNDNADFWEEPDDE